MTNEELIEDLEKLADEWENTTHIHVMMDEGVDKCAYELREAVEEYKD